MALEGVQRGSRYRTSLFRALQELSAQPLKAESLNLAFCPVMGRRLALRTNRGGSLVSLKEVPGVRPFTLVRALAKHLGEVDEHTLMALLCLGGGFQYSTEHSRLEFYVRPEEVKERVRAYSTSWSRLYDESPPMPRPSRSEMFGGGGPVSPLFLWPGSSLS